MKVFITGVSSGIGEALAKILVTEGHEVWGVSRRKAELGILSADSPKGQFRHSQCDVSDEKSVLTVAKEMASSGFVPDIVVLNAAVFDEDMIPDYSHERFKKLLETNLGGALIWVGIFIGAFLRRGSGQFIAISSTSAYRPISTSAGYSASKAALSMAFRALRLRYRKEGIVFSVVHFGPVATAISPSYIKTSKDGVMGKYFFVLTPNQAAGYIVKAIQGKRSTYYAPYLFTFLFRIGLALPDTFFDFVSRFLKRK